MTTPQLISVDAPRSGVENMRIDSECLQQIESSPQISTLIRLYRWREPTVSLGKNQRAESAVDLDYCEDRKIPVVKRPTGGRAVLHADEITYAVVSNDHNRFPIRNIAGTYAVIAEPLFEGLKSLGIEVELADGISSTSPSRDASRQKPCFATASRHELLWQGRKLVGSAQRRLRRSFLQHGSIPLCIDYEEMGRVLGYQAKLLRSGMVSVSETLAEEKSFEEVASALRSGFEKCWGPLSGIYPTAS